MDKTGNLMTDEHKKFRNIGKQYASHETVNHGAKEYARGNVNTNTVEGVFCQILFEPETAQIARHLEEPPHESVR